MEIYPEDLGPRQCTQVLEHRRWCACLDGGGPPPSPSPSGRVQASPKRERLPFWLWVFWSLIALCIAGEALHFSFAGYFLPVVTLIIFWRRRQGGKAPVFASAPEGSAGTHTGTYARLTGTEIALLQNKLLQKGSNDSVLELYLDLVWAAMNTAPLRPGQAETERDAREAIRALGAAIDALPPRSLADVPNGHAALEATAARLAAEATGESDPVVAASLGRRAEALRGQAETVARVRVLLRRNSTLREELADQIGALRTSLTAAALGGDDSGPEMAGLAARIRRVASEANAVTAARVEVDALLSQTRAGVPAAQEELRQQRVGLNGEVL